jgi:hypothetical protein
MIGVPTICSVCHTNNWNVGDGLVRLVLQTDPLKVILAGPSYPLIPLICSTCGNTQLLNAFILGLGETLGIKTDTPATLAKDLQESGNG